MSLKLRTQEIIEACTDVSVGCRRYQFRFMGSKCPRNLRNGYSTEDTNTTRESFVSLDLFHTRSEVYIWRSYEWGRGDRIDPHWCQLANTIKWPVRQWCGQSLRLLRQLFTLSCIWHFLICVWFSLRDAAIMVNNDLTLTYQHRYHNYSAWVLCLQ